MKSTQISWDHYFIRMAMLIAMKSKDPSTKVGCVIIGPDNEIRSTGFNGFPRGVRETAEGSEHLPDKFERSLAGNEYFVLCLCGDRITIPISKLDANVNGVFPAGHSYKEMVDSVAEANDHFQQQKSVLSERWERPAKYEWVEHAERNAVYNAARIGVSVAGCRAYLNWEPRPCVECCKGFIQAGIIEVIGPDIPFPSGGTRKDWKFEVSTIMMQESGVGCREVAWNDEKES